MRENSPSHASTFKSFALLTAAGIPLAKTSHMAKCSVKGQSHPSPPRPQPREGTARVWVQSTATERRRPEVNGGTPRGVPALSRWLCVPEQGTVLPWDSLLFFICKVKELSHVSSSQPRTCDNHLGKLPTAPGAWTPSKAN